MILDATTRKLQALMAGAVTTTNPSVAVDYVDSTASSFVSGFTPSNLNGVTAVDVLAAPAAGTQRKVNSISIYNGDTVSNQIQVRYNDNGTTYLLVSVLLGVKSTLVYTDTAGWFSIDSGGSIVTALTGSGRINRVPQVLTSGTTYTTVAGTTGLETDQCGGGGGGGGAATAAVSAAAGGGGAAGGYLQKRWVVAPLTAYTYAIGGAGAAGTSAGGTGGTGGITTFAVGTTVTANGGIGGIGMTAATTLKIAEGGASPAISTNGDINTGGDPGSFGLIISGIAGSSGKGGSSAYGAGGVGLAAAGVGVASTGFGGGGGGALVLNGSAAVAGAVGGIGQIVAYEFT